jgi:hypothetical protein
VRKPKAIRSKFTFVFSFPNMGVVATHGSSYGLEENFSHGAIFPSELF